MTTKWIFDEMKLSLEYDLFELVDEYDEDGDRITIFKDETMPNWYIINVESITESGAHYVGTGMKPKSELEAMSEAEFSCMISVTNYYARLVD